MFIGRSDGHGNKTIYIKAPAGEVIRHDATIAAIADALKTFGDTRPVQHRRADAVGIIADARYTEELLTQARHHRPHQPSHSCRRLGCHRRPGRHCPGQPLRRAPPLRGPRLRTPGKPEAGDHGRHATSRNTSPTHGPIDHPTRADHPTATTQPGASAARRAAANPGTGSGSWRGDEDLLDAPASGPASDWASECDGPANEWDEPGPDDEADRDAPHPSTSDLPDPLDTPDTVPIESFDPFDPALRSDPDDGEPLDAAAQRALHARLARIRHDAYTNPTSPPGTNDIAGGTHTGGGRLRPGQTEIYVHLTDHTLATGTGVLRVEGLGPLLADQLAELVGHGPYTVKPVIDLHDAVSVDAYEIPDRIRERVKLIHPVEVFPFGSQETRRSMDLDHVEPYDPLGPPGQTSTREPRAPGSVRPPGEDPRPRLERPPLRPQDAGMDHTPRLHLPRRPHRHPPITQTHRPRCSRSMMRSLVNSRHVIHERIHDRFVGELSDDVPTPSQVHRTRISGSSQTRV